MNLEKIDLENAKASGNAIKKHVLMYPDENVVRYLANNFKDKNANKNKKFLDVGFGSGRHLSLARDYGFEIYGIDYSKQACQSAREIFNLNEEIENLNLKESNFQKNSFDAVLCWGVLCLNPREQIKKDLIKIKGLLKNGGGLLINFRAKGDILHKRAKKTGKKLGKRFYLLKDEDYKGLCFQFMSLKDCKKLFKEVGFKIKKTQKLDFYRDSMKNPQSSFIFWLEK